MIYAAAGAVCGEYAWLMHYLLLYEAGPDYIARRTPHRAAHLQLAQAAADRGELVAAGALGPADGTPAEESALLFKGDSPAAAEAFAQSDPYVTSGVIQRWRVMVWTTVVGPLAESPIARAVAVPAVR